MTLWVPLFVTMACLLEDRHRKGGSLPRTRLRAPNDVTPGENLRDRSNLDLRAGQLNAGL